MLTISDVVAHLQRSITNNRLAQDRLIHDLNCFNHRSNRRYTAERLESLAAENDVVGDLLNWIRDNLNADSWVDEQPVYQQGRSPSHDGALTTFNGQVAIALDKNRCDVLV